MKIKLCLGVILVQSLVVFCYEPLSFKVLSLKTYLLHKIVSIFDFKGGQFYEKNHFTLKQTFYYSLKKCGCPSIGKFFVVPSRRLYFPLLQYSLPLLNQNHIDCACICMQVTPGANLIKHFINKPALKVYISSQT